MREDPPGTLQRTCCHDGIDLLSLTGGASRGLSTPHALCWSHKDRLSVSPQEAAARLFQQIRVLMSQTAQTLALKSCNTDCCGRLKTALCHSGKPFCYLTLLYSLVLEMRLSKLLKSRTALRALVCYKFYSASLKISKKPNVFYSVKVLDFWYIMLISISQWLFYFIVDVVCWLVYLFFISVFSLVFLSSCFLTMIFTTTFHI